MYANVQFLTAEVFSSFCKINVLFSIGAYVGLLTAINLGEANNESSEVCGHLMPVTFKVNPSTRLDNATNF